MAPPRKPHKDEVTPGQRALWTFLGATLIGPFIGALALATLMFAAGLAGSWPPSQRLQPGQLGPLIAAQIPFSYVWAAFPAAVAGALSAAWLALNGTLPWLVAATTAAVATTIAAVMAGLPAQAITPLAFIAAGTGVAVWSLLRRARIAP